MCMTFSVGMHVCEPHWLLSERTQVKFLASTPWWLTIICNSNPNGPDALSGLCEH